MTPSAGRLAALAPPWVQSSPGYAAQEADATPQHLLQIQPHRQSGFLSPAPHSIESNPADTAPPSRLSIGDQAGRPPRPPSTVIRWVEDMGKPPYVSDIHIAGTPLKAEVASSSAETG